MGGRGNPCHGCPERTETCHAECERYRLWRVAKDAEYEQRRQAMLTRWDVNAVKEKYISKRRKRDDTKYGGQF